MNGHGFSLWLRPDEKQAAQIEDVISELSMRHRTTAFPAYVPLLCGFTGRFHEVHDKCKALATILPPITIVSDRVVHTDDYFRCIVMRLRQTQALAVAHQSARDLLNPNDTAPMWPHVCLLHGRFDLGLRQQIICGIDRDLMFGFRPTTLELVETEGPTYRWTTRAEFPLR